MKNLFVAQNIKPTAITLFATGSFIILFSLFGHFLTPTKLIPSSFMGGSVGLMAAIYFSFRQSLLSPANALPVFFWTLFIFGLVSFLLVFNFSHPLVLLCGFTFVGLTPAITKQFLQRHSHFSKNKFYGLIGILFSLPALYFMAASYLKFQAGVSFFFSPINVLLNQKHGQENFNAITPFLFGGGLLLAFILNLFSQINLLKNNKAGFGWSIAGLRINLVNMTICLLTLLAGLSLAVYLVIETLH